MTTTDTSPNVARRWQFGFASSLRRLCSFAVIDQATVSLASFIATVIIGRMCGAEQLGLYSVAVKTFWLMAGIPNALVWVPYTSRVPRQRGRSRAYYLGSVTAHLAVASVISTGVLVILAAVTRWGVSGREWLPSLCLAMIPFSATMLFREHIRRVMLANMDAAGLLILDIPIAFLQLLCMGGLVWLGQLTAVTGLLALAFASLWMLVWVMRNQALFRFDAKRIRTHWSYDFQFGKWLFVVSISWLVGEAICYWLVESFHGLTELGQYSAALTMVMFFNPITLTAQNLARSILANNLAQGGRQSLRVMSIRGTRWVALSFGMLFLGLATSGGFVVELFFGDRFAGLGPVVATLCLGMYFYVLAIPVEAALSALQDGRSILSASLVRLALIVCSGVPLIAFWGPTGVGVALAIGSAGALISQWYFFWQRCASDVAT